jgi:hypothetical protein
MEDVVMGDEFGQDQNKSDGSESDLHSLAPKALAGNRLPSPLGRGSFPEGANPPDYVEIHACPKDSKRHHRNTDRILMKTGCGTFGSHRGCGEGSQSDRQPQATQYHNYSTGTLQYDEKQAGYTDGPTADSAVIRRLKYLTFRTFRTGAQYALDSHFRLTI